MTLGTTAVPRWSRNSAPITTGWWCLIPDVPALGWSCSYVLPTPEAIRDGGARSARNLPIPQPPPPLRALCSRPAPSASIFSSFYPSEKTEETLEKSIQLNGKPGVGEGATFLLPSISKVWGRPREMAPKSQVVPHPTHLLNLHTTITHSTGGTGAPARRRLSAICANTRLPTPTPRPHDWHPLLPLPLTPMAVNDRTGHTCVLHWI